LRLWFNPSTKKEKTKTKQQQQKKPDMK
jgi:hypothetical protein